MGLFQQLQCASQSKGEDKNTDTHKIKYTNTQKKRYDKNKKNEHLKKQLGVCENENAYLS